MFAGGQRGGVDLNARQGEQRREGVGDVFNAGRFGVGAGACFGLAGADNLGKSGGFGGLRIFVVGVVVGVRAAADQGEHKGEQKYGEDKSHGVSQFGQVKSSYLASLRARLPRGMLEHHKSNNLSPRTHLFMF